MKLHEEDAARRKKIIDKIPVKIGKDKLGQRLQKELQQAESKDRWKAVLTSRLTPSLKDLIADLQADPMSDFQVDCVGCTAAQAGQAYHCMKLHCNPRTWHK